VPHLRQYIDKKLSLKAMDLIALAAPIIERYEADGYAMTLRQVHYQLVAHHPDQYENTQDNYNRLGDVISDGRMAGLISWTAIEDRVRFLRGSQTWETPDEALKDARDSYLTDRWQNQPVRPEIWVEKDALLGVLERVCTELGLNYFSCKGYSSQSELWRAGQRFAGYVQKGQRPIVFYLGDHDPSGLNMVQSNRKKLELFAGVPIQIVPLAITMEQIKRYEPPPSPVKMKDARTKGYIEEHGIEDCWELDALPPDVLIDVVRGAVLRVRDPVLWDEALAKEAADKNDIDEMMENMRS
jgi:hypothetical protein